jgi:iron complex outermembrane receptor protein
MFPLLLTLFVVSSTFAHTEDLEVIEVTHGRDQSTLLDFVPSATELKEKDLLKRRGSTLGETLRYEPGVQSTSFGPNAGRPIIRGLDGDRIRILQNGLGTLDASSQSVDHAIPIDMLTVDKVEVVRGPMGLLYGSSAVGGVVNIVNNRVHREFSEGLVNQVDLRGETVNNGGSGASRIDYGKDKWMFHFDGSYQNVGETKIPGHALSKKARSQGITANDTKNRLKNSDSQQSSFAVGASRIFDRGHVGISYYRFDNDYGTVVNDNVDIRMQQNRIELSSEYRPEESKIKKFTLRSAQSFYKHEEIEGDTVGTTFKNSGNESRLEMYTEKGQWTGVSGLQTQISSFKASGAEAFLPTAKNNIASAFTLQEYHFNEKRSLQFGGRFENTFIKKESSSTFGASDQKGFSGINGSLGYLQKFSKTYSLSASLSYTERAPNFQELFAKGQHVATGTSELGNSHLKKEKAQAFELSFKKDNPDSKLTINGFVQKFQDYIALSPLGTFTAGAGIQDYSYRQQKALLYGGEISSREELIHELAGGSWWLNTTADLVIGKNLATGHYLPRLPAPKLVVGLQYQRDRIDADIEIEKYFEQQHHAPGENRTEGFQFLNVGAMYELPYKNQNYRLYFRAKNILNQEGRLHTSYLKEVAPLPGRNFIAGVQALF